jgi:hypothetical protein
MGSGIARGQWIAVSHLQSAHPPLDCRDWIKRPNGCSISSIHYPSPVSCSARRADYSCNVVYRRDHRHQHCLADTAGRRSPWLTAPDVMDDFSGAAARDCWGGMRGNALSWLEVAGGLATSRLACIMRPSRCPGISDCVGKRGWQPQSRQHPLLNMAVWTKIKDGG